jgi:hypothetical protein
MVCSFFVWHFIERKDKKKDFHIFRTYNSKNKANMKFRKEIEAPDFDNASP